MAGLNSNIIMSSVGNEVPLNDLSQVYMNAANFRQTRNQIEAGEESTRQKTVLNEAYKQATRPDGSVDEARLQAHLAGNMGGAQIPGIQKAQVALQKDRADVASTKATTGKNVQETLYKGLSLVDNTLASLIARPDVNPQMVYGEMGRLVNSGAFDIQAQHKGVSADVYAKELLSTMPIEPQSLRAWLVQNGSRAADATERLKLSLPKYDEQDQGGQLNEGTIDQMTGVRTAGRTTQKVITKEAALSAQVQREGQSKVDARAKEANGIAAEAAQSQVIETPQGYAVVNKGTAMARPVAIGNNPVLGKDSVVAKNAQMADRLTGMIPLAKTLLTGGATSSGAGALIDQAMAFTGQSTKGADAATALETVSGWMTSNVPRFEGPQSDKDTATYRTMAGLVGDRTQPMSTRLKALESLEQLMQPYMGRRSSDFAGPPGTQPATVVPPRPLTPQGSGPRAPAAAPRAGAGGRPSIDSFFQ